MPDRRLLLLAAGLLLLAGCTTPRKPGAPAANVTVEFKDPDKFRDVRDGFTDGTDQNALAALRTCLQEAAGDYLKPDQKLHVTFTELDLAGDIPPGSINRIRLLKPIYFPSAELTFELTDAAGKVLKEGQRQLRDMDYQMNATRIGHDQPYFYDRVMLEDWMRKEFR